MKIRSRFARINRCERFWAATSNLWNRPAASRDLAPKKPQVLRGHEWQVDRKDKQMAGAGLCEAGSQSTERPPRRWVVGHKFHIRRAPQRIASRRDENFRRPQLPQCFELFLPERFATKQERRLVCAHPARFTSGEQRCSDFHSLTRLQKRWSARFRRLEFWRASLRGLSKNFPPQGQTRGPSSNTGRIAALRENARPEPQIPDRSIR